MTTATESITTSDSVNLSYILDVLMLQHTAMASVSTFSSSFNEIRDAVCVTIVIVLCFAISKSSYDCVRQCGVLLNVVIIGAGPVGLTSALIAAYSKKVANIIMFEEKNRAQLFARSQQIALDADSIRFLKTLQVDFDNIEGCWQHDRFYTRIGIFQDYLLSSLERLGANVDIKLGTKFTDDEASKLSSKQYRTLVVVADGVLGLSASNLGLSDEFIIQSCKTFGAIMRNIFQESYNTYRTKGERKIIDIEAYNMRCTHRLSEIKLSTRRESVVYIQDDDVVVIVEGDAARNLNFNLGFEVNVGFLGLQCLDNLLDLLTAADTENKLFDALKWKLNHSKKLNDDIVNFCMKDAMKMTKPRLKGFGTKPKTYKTHL